MRIAVTSVIDLERCAHNRLHEFLTVLTKRHDVTVFGIQDYWKGSQVEGTLYAAGFEEMIRRVRVIPYTRRRISPVAQEAIGATRARKLIDSAGEKFDIHFDYNTLLSGRAFAKEFERRGVPTVYDLADDLVAMVEASPQVPRIARSPAAAFAQRALDSNLRRARYVTVINQTLALDAKVSPSKVRTVANGVDTLLFSPKGPIADLKQRLEGSLVLGYVGVLREWVDFDPVLEAMASAKHKSILPRPLKLLIVGEEGGRTRIVERARILGVLDDVYFAGTVPYPEVPSYLRCIDIGLIPFNPGKIGANSLPLKLFEYMSMGKPVISTPLPGVRECARERARYALSGDEYLDAVQEVLRANLPGEAAQNQAWVHAHYSWQAAGEKLERVLVEATGGP